MSFKTGAGCTIAIGTTLAAPNGTQAEYEADTYVTVSENATIGPFGDERQSVEFISLADSRTQKARGSADAGNQEITFAHKTGDAGQLALKAAFEVTSQTADEFNFRVQFNDSLGTNPTKNYFRARVMSRQVQEISTNSPLLVRATLGINTAILEVSAA